MTEPTPKAVVVPVAWLIDTAAVCKAIGGERHPLTDGQRRVLKLTAKEASDFAAALSPVPSSVGSAAPADGNTVGVSDSPTPVPSGVGEPVMWGCADGNGIDEKLVYHDKQRADGAALTFALTVVPLYASPVPAVEAGWRTMESAPKDGRKIIVTDKFDNAKTIWWDPTEYGGEARGWIAKGGYHIDCLETAFVGWTSAPGEPSPPSSDHEAMRMAITGDKGRKLAEHIASETVRPTTHEEHCGCDQCSAYDAALRSAKAALVRVAALGGGK